MGFLVAILAFFLSACSSTSYLVGAGVGQWRLFNRERPVDEVLQNPNTPEATKKAIRTVIDAKKFAVENLGLKATKNYTSFVQLDADYVSWAVSAADPLLLKERKWKFPIVGEVPYLGFFKKSQAEDFAAKMRAEEPRPDVWVRGVPAFSSLGWFADPLYSSMIRGDDFDIIDTVIHESLHATVWVGDSVDFNERLANFVGLEGALEYLRARYADGGRLQQARAMIAGEKIFGLFMKEEEARYRQEVKTIDDKNGFYAGILERYNHFFEQKSKDGSAEKLPVQFKNWNNAAFLSYANYYSDYSVFEEMLAKCNHDLKRFVRWIALEQKKTERFRSAPEEFLKSLVKEELCTD